VIAGLSSRDQDQPDEDKYVVEWMIGPVPGLVAREGNMLAEGVGHGTIARTLANTPCTSSQCSFPHQTRRFQ